MLFILLIGATVTYASTSTIAEKVYMKGRAYGVTLSHQRKMKEYFTTNPVTPEEEAYVLAREDECIAIMKKAGVKYVTELSESDLNKVKALVQDAAQKIGLRVTYTNNAFYITKNGKTIGEFLYFFNGTIYESGGSVENTDSKTGKTSFLNSSTSIRKFVYTGSNYTLFIASAVIGIIAIGGVVRLRKRV